MVPKLLGSCTLSSTRNFPPFFIVSKRALLSSAFITASTPCGVWVSLICANSSGVTKKVLAAQALSSVQISVFFSSAASVRKSVSIAAPLFMASAQTRSPSATNSAVCRRQRALFWSLAACFICALSLLVSVIIVISKNSKSVWKFQTLLTVNNYAFFAFSTSAVKAAGSAMAISESILRLRVTPAFLSPLIKVE